MKINRIHEIAFSPNFSTDSTALIITKSIAESLKLNYFTDKFTTPDERSAVRTYSEDELLIIASPTYAGKLPNKILSDFQTKLKGNNTAAVALVSYGNRSYDNSLAELCDCLKNNGFNVIAGAAIVNEHCMSHIAPGRPNQEDILFLKEFGEKVAKKILSDDCSSPSIPGDAKAAYYIPKQLDGQPAKFLSAKPKTKDTCTNCGLCARLCPMGSIDSANCAEVNGICIKCHACVNQCPIHAKFFDDIQLLSHLEYLIHNFSKENKNECYL